jgi:hypothetical protein
MRTGGGARILGESSSEQSRPPCAGRLLRFVRLSSERARHAVRQDCSFAKKQKSPSALSVVVRHESVLSRHQDASFPREGAAADLRPLAPSLRQTEERAGRPKPALPMK